MQWTLEKVPSFLHKKNIDKLEKKIDKRGGRYEKGN